MTVAGFTFIRNAIQYDYPILEAVRSILPLCDEVYIAVGRSEDETLPLIRSLNDPRIRILETVWDETLREGGRVLADETNKAFQAIPQAYDWCVYIQGDECLHEADLPVLHRAMRHYLPDKRVEGLLLSYHHFYGSYDYVGASRRWYRREVRVIRNDKSIRSWRDAQGFRMRDGRKLRVAEAPCRVYHYGWVKHPEAQQRKQKSFNKLWHDDEAVKAMVGENNTYEYDGAEPLVRFTGAHPAVMRERIAAVNWSFAHEPQAVRPSPKERLSDLVERLTGWRPGEYKNFRLIDRFAVTPEADEVRLTEQASAYRHLERMSTLDLIRNINAEDQKVPLAVEKAIPQITALVDALVSRMQQGGRLFYLGAGTSGRLGILDASEIPPTFGAPPDWVIGLIAGGDRAIRKAVEGAEDAAEQAWLDLAPYRPGPLDMVVGIAASGTTPYVVQGLRRCREAGIPTGCITCNPGAPIVGHADYPVEVLTGPEFVTGSTRMKAGTAQKLVLNMISTAAMIRLGRVMDNRMVDMQPSNEKLLDRGARMIMAETGLSYAEARALLVAKGSVRAALADRS